MTTFLVIVECDTDGEAGYPIGVAADALKERGMFTPREGVRPLRIHLAIEDSANRILSALNDGLPPEP